MPVIESYLQAAKAISEKFGLSDSDIKLIDIMKLPDAISADKEEQDAEIISSQVESVLTCALNDTMPCVRQKHKAVRRHSSPRTAHRQFC